MLESYQGELENDPGLLKKIEGMLVEVTISCDHRNVLGTGRCHLLTNFLLYLRHTNSRGGKWLWAAKRSSQRCL